MDDGHADAAEDVDLLGVRLDGKVVLEEVGLAPAARGVKPNLLARVRVDDNVLGPAVELALVRWANLGRRISGGGGSGGS